MDLAASIQAVTEEIMLRCGRHVHRTTGMRNLCLAGGVALNCVGNGRLLREGPFEDIWIQPAAGDAGGALGAALLVWHQLLDKPRQPQPARRQQGSLLGPAYSDDEIQALPRRHGRAVRALRPTTTELLRRASPSCSPTARSSAGSRAAWSSARARSAAARILGDPRDPQMQSTMNLKIKFRECFRRSRRRCCEEHVRRVVRPRPRRAPTCCSWRRCATRSCAPLTADEQQLTGLDRLNVPRSTIPAVTHVDYSARIQTVTRTPTRASTSCCSAFDRLTGCPVLVNTSFNVRGEPIVCTPQDAYRCFLRTDMDVLVIGSFLLDQRAKRAIDLGVRATLEQDWGALGLEQSRGTAYALDD